MANSNIFSRSRKYFITLYNVCSVQRGMFSTSGGVQYIGGCSYHEYIGGYHEYIGGYHEYIGGYHEYIGGYHEYIGGCSVHRRDTMSTSGCSVHRRDTMSTSGGYHEYIGGYHDTCGGIP